jgi:hypothetical protein
MQDENHEKEEHDLPLRKRLKAGSNTGDAADSRDGEQPQHSLLSYSAQWHLAVATDLGRSDLRHPGSPGIFFESPIPALSLTNIIPAAGIREQRRIDEYHDSDLGDIYDLYNACNGVVHNGFLDIRKLDELTAEERAFLDIERLREIWLHTTSGCATCAGIIRTLNSIRGILTDEEERGLPESAFRADSEPH